MKKQDMPSKDSYEHTAHISWQGVLAFGTELKSSKMAKQLQPSSTPEFVVLP